MSLGELICERRSLETNHSSSMNRGGFESYGHRYQETSHSNSSNCGGRGHRLSLTSHSSSGNYVGYVDISGSRSQETIHFTSCNQETRFDIEGIYGYRSQASHYFSNN